MAIARGEITITELYDGDSFYRAWADTPDGSGSSFTTEESDRAYLGVYSGREEPTHYSQYKWSKIRGESAITAILSNDSHQVGTDENGDHGNYTGAKTTVTVFKGGEDDTLNWKVERIKIEPAGAVTGEFIDTYTYKVEDLKKDEASVAFILNHIDSQYSPLEKTFTLSKNKQGISGQHATNYFLSFNDTAVKKFRETETMEPAELMMQGMSIKADQKPVPQSGYFKIYEQSEIALDRDQYEQAYMNKKLDELELYVISEKNYPLILTYTSKEPEERLTYKYTDLKDIMSIKVYWYRDADFEELIDVQTISITSDGEKGETGEPGTSYWLTSSVDTITVKYNGDYDPKTITYYGYSKTGSDNVESYAGRFIIQTSIDGINFTQAYLSPVNTNKVDFLVPEDVLFIKAKFYQADGTTYLLDEQTIPVLHSAEYIEQEIKRSQNTAWIRAGIRVGYSSFTQTNPNSVYICGLEYRDGYRDMVLVDKPAEIYVRDSEQTDVIPNQALSVSGIPAGTTTYIIWDNTKKELFFIYYESVMTSTRVSKKRWRNIAGQTIEFTDSLFAIGEVEV